MNEEIIKIFDGINLHFVNTDKFKTDLIATFFITELNMENVTKNALIPAVLRRGTEARKAPVASPSLAQRAPSWAGSLAAMQVWARLAQGRATSRQLLC